MTGEQRAESEVAERADADTLLRRWLGPQRWAVSPGSDLSIAMTEVELADSSAADVMQAFVTIGALRETTARIEMLGAVPGMVTVVPRTRMVEALYRAEGIRLLAALTDSTRAREVLDSVRRAPWSNVDISLWSADDVELLLASRRRQHPEGEYAHYAQEQRVIAERPVGQPDFTAVDEWHTAYDTDETASMWVEDALRVGPFCESSSSRGQTECAA